MRAAPDENEADRTGSGRTMRAREWRPPDRHILLGVSHASDDPARHRVFEVRATFDAATGGWLARVAEQNLNEQRKDWGPLLTNEGRPSGFPTAAACLGNAVAIIVAMTDREEPSAPAAPTASRGEV